MQILWGEGFQIPKWKSQFYSPLQRHFCNPVFFYFFEQVVTSVLVPCI